MGLKKRVIKLEENLGQAFQKIEEQQARIEEQQAEIEKLRGELAKYKNPNTPSSANKHLQPSKTIEKEINGKRGAPFGHKGVTRKRVPTKKNIIDCDTCPKCGSHNLKDRHILKRVIDDMDEKEKEVETSENEIHKKECLDCKHEFIPPENTVPLKGTVGVSVLVMVVFIKFILRGVLRKTMIFMDSTLTKTWTPASINAMISRVADAAENEFEDIKKRIIKASRVYVDETSFSVLGKNQWVWVFRTERDILIVIRASRGSNVLKEILGERYKGVVICDCWRAYDFFPFALIQRCWSHLLRKSKELIDTVVGKHFHEQLKALFEEIKQFNLGNPTQEQRDIKYQELTERLKELVKYYSKYGELTPIIKYINNHIGQWFTCVMTEGIEPTNNFAEQAIRETVMVRKIIGAFRSELGRQSYERLASLFATWQIRGLDLKKELRGMLIKNLCFC